MTGDLKCPACVIRFDSVVNGWSDDNCTRRPGCVRAAREAGLATEGGADTAALVAILSSFDGGVLPRIMRSYAQEAADALVAKDAEIARLRERLAVLTISRQVYEAHAATPAQRVAADGGDQ
jgi:hypothetical protein